ncbi:unnamed protein product [Rhizoctonia solani]|nr:unnamed protein product [Rhizoctonia solani]
MSLFPTTRSRKPRLPAPRLAATYIYGAPEDNDEQEENDDEREDSDDELRQPAGTSQVPEDDVQNVPINIDDAKRNEVLQKIAVSYWEEILAITSFAKEFAIVHYTTTFDSTATGSVKSRAGGYTRQAISIWGNLVWLRKAYQNVVVTRASQMAHLQRRFVGLRRTGYLNKRSVTQYHLHRVGNDNQRVYSET